jgi:hypothetical protein
MVGRHMAGPGMFPLAHWRMSDKDVKALKTAAGFNLEWHFKRTVQVRTERVLVKRRC